MGNNFKQIYAGEISLAPNMAKANQYTGFSMKQAVSQLQDVAMAGLHESPFGQNYHSGPVFANGKVTEGKNRSPLRETVAAHSLLTEALFERALIENYGPDFGEPGAKVQKTEDGYTYREAIEAVKVYCLTSTQADKDESEKKLFYSKYAGNYNRGISFAQQIIKLVESVDSPETPTAKMLKLADRTASIFMSLTKDRKNESDLITRGHPLLTEEERGALIKLPNFAGSSVKVSQFLLYKYFKMDKLTLLDDTGFFTAIIIAYVLNVSGTWPLWREEDYM